MKAQAYHRRQSTSYIAPEGQPYIIWLLLISWGAYILFHCWLLNILLFLLLIFLVQFFRDPLRNIPNDDEQAALSPADGKIVVVEQSHDPYRQIPALKISIFMNVFNVHVNRVPLRGKVQKVDYFAGKFLNANLDKASEENERNALLLKTKTADITVVQVAGLIARRILCYCKTGDELARGERYGFIRFGSRVDVYLPSSAEPKVVIGQKVKAVSTVLAQL